jgi:tetratricopeptide (TPR) repeat protein
MIYLEEIFGWLNCMTPSSMTVSSSAIRDQLAARIQTRSFITAYQIIEHFKKIGLQSIMTLERAEIWAECGLAFFEMGNPFEAIEAFKQSLANCPPGSHSQAIVRWMLGEVQWHIDSEHDTAIRNWEKTLEELSVLEQQADYKNRIPDRDWYRDRMDELHGRLNNRVVKTYSKM